MAFGKIRHTQILGEKGTTWYVEIWQKDYTGSSVDSDLHGEGFEIKWSGEGGTRAKTFIGSECIINLYVKEDADEDFLYDDIFKKGEKYHYVRIYKNNINDSSLWWFGWIQPGFDSVQNSPYPYATKITATDSYGYFTKRKDDELSGETIKNTAYPISNHLLEFGGASTMGISTSTTDVTITPNPGIRQWLRTAIDWWRPEDTYQSNDPFTLYATTKGAFTEPTEYDTEGNITNSDKAYKYNKSDVFNGSLKALNSIGFLAEGYYYFTQPNNLVNNDNGTLNVWQRRYGVDATSLGNMNTTITIDQSNNTILGGSVLNYDPSLESVGVEFILGPTNLFVTPSTDLTSSFISGAIQLPTNSEDLLDLSFHAAHKENFNVNQFNYSTFLDNSSIRNSTFLTTATLIISITDGTTTKYLQPPASGLGPFIWTTSGSPLSITIARGYDEISVSGALNNNYCVGLPYNPISYDSSNTQNIIASDNQGPCQVGFTPGSYGYGLSFSTDINFNASVEAPGIIGDVSIQMTASNNYSQYGTNTVGGYTQYYIINITNPTPTSQSTECESIFMSPLSDTQFEETATGFNYLATQSEVTSSEFFDLGKLQIGSTLQNKLYSVQHYNSSTNQWDSSTGFQRGNPTTDNPLNINQLLVNEFLALQVNPLEILQAEIQSNNISPLRLIKYSINDDSSFKYYTFLGGTFKAQSEIMSGEWYKVNDDVEYVTSGETSFKGVNKPKNQTPVNVLNQVVVGTSNIIQTDLSNDNIGIIDTAILSNTSTDKVEINGVTTSKVYDNQELILSYPNGSNAIVLKSRSESSKGATQVLLDAFTTGMIYPIGSILRPLKSDLTNIIHESTTPNLYKGVTESVIYIRPDEFNIFNKTGYNVYSRVLGSIQSNAYSGQTTISATTFIPTGYEVTSIDVYSNANRSFTIYNSRVTNATTTSQGTGTANTTFTLSTPWASVLGDYILISYDLGDVSDEIYGAKLNITLA